MLVLIIYAALVLLCDQGSKRVVQACLVGPLSFGRLFRIREVHHRQRLYEGVLSRIAMVLVWCAAFASIVLLRTERMMFQNPIATLGLGCALGGAAGNLVDILRRRHVVDFIDLGWWPVFNLADVAIVGGLLVALLSAAPHL
jgi:signal peptidase II